MTTEIKQIKGRAMVGCEAELIEEIQKLRKCVDSLTSAAHYASYILGKIPAFGDSIGQEINKAQIGMARNVLDRAMKQAINSTTPVLVVSPVLV